MTSNALILERFDSSGRAGGGESVLIQRARAEAYSEGFAAGSAAVEAAANEEERFLAAVRNAVETELAGIPDQVNRRMSEAFRLVLEKIFPALAQSRFAEEAAKAFAEIQVETGVASIDVAAPPDKVEPLRAVLEKLSPTGAINVTPDPELEGAVAKATWPGGGLDFNLDRAIAQCISTLEDAVKTLGNRNES